MKKLLFVGIIFFGLPCGQAGWGATDESSVSDKLERCESMQEYLDKKLVRPSPKERVTLIKLLEQKPRPKTFIDADVKYLRSLLEKPVWTGGERRIVKEMWQEVAGHTVDGQPPDMPAAQ